MPDIWPTFGLTRRRQDETGELSSEILKVHEPQATTGTNEYGIYDGVGIILNGNRTQVTTPNEAHHSTWNIIIREDIGFANKITLYVISDATDRIIGPEATYEFDPAWYDDDTLGGRAIEVQWAEHTSRGLTVANGVKAFAGNQSDWSNPIHTGPLFATTTSPAEPYSTSAVTTVSVGGGKQYFPLQNSILRVRDIGPDGMSRITILGIEINGILYGKNANEKTQEDLLAESFSAGNEVTGGGWWRDLKNTEQTPSSLDPDPSLKITPLSFEAGWNELNAAWAADPIQDNWEVIVDARTEDGDVRGQKKYRDNAIYVGYMEVRKRVGEDLTDGVVGSFPALDNSYRRRPVRSLALADARWDNGYWTAKAPAGTTLWTSELTYTRGFRDPAYLNDGSGFGNLMIEAYVAGYNAYYDGYAQGLAQTARNSSPLQTGDADYNWIIDECHFVGWEDGNDQFRGRFGARPPGDGDDD